MQPTQTGRVTVPEDPEEIRALFRRRMRERDKLYNNPQGSPKGDTAPEEGRDTKEPRRTPAKRPGQRPKPYRLIYLTGEEARAIEERRLTVEEIKALNEDRDDVIPKVQTTSKVETQGATVTRSPTGNGPTRDAVDQTSLPQKSSSSTSSERVHETGPDVTPARAREDSETGRVHAKDQASS